MKVLFLDFDGVLNCDRYVRDHGRTGVMLDPGRLALVKRIIDATGASIVLSTSWREYWSPIPEECHETGALINRLFREQGLTIYDKTPRLAARREQEIARWLADFPAVTRFAVLDDEQLDTTGFLQGHFVKTAYYGMGLSPENADEAIRILQAE